MRRKKKKTEKRHSDKEEGTDRAWSVSGSDREVQERPRFGFWKQIGGRGLGKVGN